MTPLPRLNIERYRDIGAYLHDVRLQQKRGIDEIAQALNIRAVHLEAIERSNMDALPGLAYARGFVVRYAEELGLHGETVWVRYQKMQHVEEDTPLYVPQADRMHDLPNKTARRISLAMLGVVGLLWYQSLPPHANSLVDMSILEEANGQETKTEKAATLEPVPQEVTAEIAQEAPPATAPKSANEIRDCIATIASPCQQDTAETSPASQAESMLAPTEESQ